MAYPTILKSTKKKLIALRRYYGLKSDSEVIRELIKDETSVVYNVSKHKLRGYSSASGNHVILEVEAKLYLFLLNEYGTHNTKIFACIIEEIIKKNAPRDAQLKKLIKEVDDNDLEMEFRI